MSKPTQLILVRHAQSQANAGTSTDPDCALSPLGEQQAADVASRLARHDLGGFHGVVSPYGRARQTADAITLATGLGFEMDEGIREWAGPATINGVHYPAEPREALAVRVREFLARHAGRKLVVVSHAATIAALTQLAWDETPHLQGEFWAGVPNASMRWLLTT